MNKQFSNGIGLLWNTCCVFGRDLFEISDFGRCILLGIPFSFTALSIVIFLDQWVVNHGRCMDSQSICELCMSIVTILSVTINGCREQPNCWLRALESIPQIGRLLPGKHVSWTKISYTLLILIYPDLIFFAITTFATIFGIFFNNLLPSVDVRSSINTILSSWIQLTTGRSWLLSGPYWVWLVRASI